MSAISFIYKARDPLGKTHEGSVEAATRDDATTKLRKDGLHVLELNEDDDGIQLLPARIGRGEIIYVTSQLSVMVDTGITLSTAIGNIAEHEQNRTLKAVLADLKQRVEGGEDFSSALSRHPKHFDKTYVALIKASEQTGTLAAMLESIAEYLRKQLETRQKVLAAMSYPCVMMVLAIGVTIFMLTYILPKFTPLFNRKGIKLPFVTKVLMSTSHLLLDYWYLWILGVIAVGAIYYFGRSSTAGRRLIDWTKLNLPLTGSLMRKIILSRSIRTLGTMIGSGVSMLDAIRLASEVSGNIYYQQVWDGVLERITQGDRVAQSLQGSKLFPPALVQMISSGEETGKLDKVLAKVSTHYDREVELNIKSTTSLIEPLMIVGMGFVVGGIAMGLLLPIFQLSRPAH